jgi:protein O-mannosyl-transferase
MKGLHPMMKGNPNLWAGLLLALVAFLVYANSLGNGFVWDDDPVILDNPSLRGSAVALLSGIDIARSTEPLPYYRPLAQLSFLAEERLHGLSPFPVRLFNVLLHCANTCLVFLLARRLFLRLPAPLLATLLFAVHPIQSEGVDFNAGGRNTLLACFFVLAACLLHKAGIGKKRLREACLGSLLFLAGLLSKESAIALLPILVWLELQPAPEGRAARRMVKPALRLLPYLLAAVVYLTIRGEALSGVGIHTDYLESVSVFLHNNLFVWPRYLLNLVWPAYLSAYYFIPADLSQLALPLLVSWCAIIAAVYWLMTGGKSQASSFGLVWALAFWLPTSGIVRFNSAPLADRFLYISAIGLWIVLADQFVQIAGRRSASGRRNLAVTVSVLLVVLAVTTFKRNRDWKDDIALFSGVIEMYPDQAWGYHNMGCAYLDKLKNLKLSEVAFQKAASLDPAFPRLQTQLGYLNLLRGDYPGAIKRYDEAIFQNPADAEAFVNRGVSLENLGRYGEALADYRRLLTIPGNEPPSGRTYALRRISELSK